MVKGKFDGSTKWYLGLDVGTNSVGWAATDLEYNVLKFNGNATWGIYLFDEAKNAQDRRINRTSRRRLARKKQRIGLLQEFFAEEISKVDENFYLRLKESALWAEDRTLAGDTRLFIGNGLDDKEYNRRYPTIHHLICDLIDNNEYHDPRLVYMACSYILSHRGHFLLDVDENKLDQVVDFISIYEDFLSWFTSNEMDIPWNCSPSDFGDVLKKRSGVSIKERDFIDLLFNGVKPKDTDETKDLSIKQLVSLISGRKVKLSDLFCSEEYKNLEIPSITVVSATFDDELDALSSSLNDGEFDLLSKVKRLYDWFVLVEIMNGELLISKAKVNVYEQHKKDVSFLKKIVKNYAPDKYDEVFRKIGKEKNYASYSYNSKNYTGDKLPDDYKMASAEDFCKYIESIVKPLDSEISSDELNDYNDMIERLAQRKFCPKQMTSDNRVIPYQLYYAELKLILENASEYLSFLNEVDDTGLSVEDKILQIMKFRIPYYVGPLNSNSSFSWIVRKSTGKILPWNFDELVDKDKSEEAFIRKMTGKCAYLAGEDVLPKNSLLYAKFTVLNEINNISVNDNKLKAEVKQSIFEDLFMKKRKVTPKMIHEYLYKNGIIKKDDVLKGIDTTIKSELKAYHDFKTYLHNGILTESQVEDIITRITLTTDRLRLRKWLVSEFNLTDDDAKKISKFKYSDFGRLSNRFLTQIFDLDAETGEVRREENIIQMLWNTNENLMMLLSSDYGYSAHVNVENKKYYDLNPKTIDERLKDMYISNAVKRPILRTLDIVNELRSIFKCDPEKVFVEMARGANENQKGRTQSRRDQIHDLYKNYDKTEVAELLSELSGKTDDELRSEKLFLYFTQLGKCMYSGKTINISEIGNQKLYDVDHIWPQSKIKDDSLDNKVLVCSEYNGKKGDSYPVPEEWRTKMFSFWTSLFDKKLISEKKYDRLKRNSRFTDEELAQFINRQLVETRQSTKAIASILKDTLPKTTIVYVKAGLASQFRQEYKDNYYTLKCREVNDLHHAKDAYLNIVMGNIYDVKYTSNPLNFIKSGAQYSLNLDATLRHDVKRGDVVAWKSDNDVWFDRVIRQLHKNNIRFVRYSYCQTGALFDLMPRRKGSGQVPRKKELDNIDKYGGYNSQTFTGFYLVSYDDKKSRETALVPVPLRVVESLKTMSDIEEFCIKEGYKNPKIELNGRLIKTNSLWEIDGYRVHLSGKSSGDIWFKGGQQLVIDAASEAYFKKISNYISRIKDYKKLPSITIHDGLCVERNLNLFDLLTYKISSTNYKTLMPSAVETLNKGKERFNSLSCEEQVIALSNIIQLFGCNNSQGKDLTLIGGVKSAGIQKMTLKINKKRFKSIRIIDQSSTGLFENKTINMCEL